MIRAPQSFRYSRVGTGKTSMIVYSQHLQTYFGTFGQQTRELFYDGELIARILLSLIRLASPFFLAPSTESLYFGGETLV